MRSRSSNRLTCELCPRTPDRRTATYVVGAVQDDATTPPLRGVLLAAAALLLAQLACPAPADDSRVVVVAPGGGTTPVPIAPDEKVGNVAAVTPAGGTPLVVVRIDKMPPKPDFNIITPDGVSHPYKNGDSGIDGLTVAHEPQVVQDAAGRTWYRVVSCYTKGGRQVACARTDYPCGSQLVPDPPQPPGLAFFCPDAEPAGAADEAAVLAALGEADTPEAQVWLVPSGELNLVHDASPGPTTITFGLESTGAAPDESADGPADSGTEDDQAADASADDASDGADEPADADGDAEVDADGDAGLDPDGSDAQEDALPAAAFPCGFGVLGAMPFCTLGLGAGRRRRRARFPRNVAIGGRS